MSNPLWTTLPDGWIAGRIKNVSAVTLGKMLQSKDSGGDVRALYMRAANVQPDGLLVLDDVNEMWFGEAELEQLKLQAGDVVVVEGGQGGFGRAAYIGEDLPGWGFQNSINRLRPFEQFDGRFIAFYLIALRASGYIRAYCNVVSMPHLTAEKLARIPIPLPPPDRQRAIADYLDRETGRIDTLIEEQRHLIDLLRERRRSLVDGVFVNQVPNVRLRNACIDIVDCPHTTPEVADDSEYEAVRTASVRNGKFRPGNGFPVSVDTWKSRNVGGAPSVGDLLFTREAPAGEACMVPNDLICLGQRMVLLRIDHSVCIGEFLLWQIYSDRVQDHFVLSANGSTVANVRLPILRMTPIWLPNLAEQRRIAEHINDQTVKIDILIAEVERFIALSKERRAALITAAVTGQINVREA
ncbi:restriction endonuclease subunit S [Actinokineospora sp. 24-640]